MARWGSLVWGTDVWGLYPMTTAEQTEVAVLSAPANWLVPPVSGPDGLYGDGTAARRNMTVHVWTVHPSTFANVNELPVIAGTAHISKTVQGTPMEQGAFTFQIADPDNEYRVGGALAGDIAPNTLIRPVAVISSPGGSLTRNLGLFRIAAPYSDGVDANGRVFLTINCEDWMRLPLTLAIGYNPTSAIHIANQIYIDHPEIDYSENTQRLWGATLNAILYVGSSGKVNLAIRYGGGQHLLPSDEVTVSNPGGETTVPALQLWPEPLISDPLAKPPSIFDLINWLHGNKELMRITYDNEGVLNVWPAFANEFRGYVFAIGDSPITGTLAIPVESYQRTLNPPAFTRFELRLDNSGLAAQIRAQQEAAGPGGGASSGGGAGVEPGPSLPTYYAFAAQASHNRFTVGLYPQQIEVVDTLAARDGLTGNSTFYCIQKIAEAMAAADQLSMVVDSAFPFAELGQAVYCYDPPAVNAWYRLASVDWPLSADAASWTLEWLRDG